jgi:hypothetical protein
MRRRPPSVTVRKEYADKADRVANDLFATSKRLARQHGNNLKASDAVNLWYHLEGYRGEAGLHEFFGGEAGGSIWTPKVYRSRAYESGPDVIFRGKNYDAKGTDKDDDERYGMNVQRKHARRDMRYVLVGVLYWPEAQLLGWCEGEIVLAAPIREWQPGRPCYYVERSRLRHCNELLGLPVPDDEPVWTPGARSESPPVRSTHNHDLKLTGTKFDKDRRWRCACGYTLGDGREKFLASCPRPR